METYKIVYLQIAKRDILDTVSYIADTLHNATAAAKLASELKTMIEGLSKEPYMYPVYIPSEQLRYEYRKFNVGNYLVFYRVSESDKTVTIARVIYGKRDLKRKLR